MITHCDDCHRKTFTPIDWGGGGSRARERINPSIEFLRELCTVFLYLGSHTLSLSCWIDFEIWAIWYTISGECCLCKLIASTYFEQIGAIHQTCHQPLQACLGSQLLKVIRRRVQLLLLMKPRQEEQLAWIAMFADVYSQRCEKSWLFCEVPCCRCNLARMKWIGGHIHFTTATWGERPNAKTVLSDWDCPNQ